MREIEIQNAIRLRLGREPDLVLWRNAAGFAERDGRKTRFGLVRGASDLIGILTVSVGAQQVGVFVAFEIKTSRGRLTDEQKLFGELVSKRGGIFAVLRSVEDAELALDRARKEIRSRLES